MHYAHNMQHVHVLVMYELFLLAVRSKVWVSLARSTSHAQYSAWYNCSMFSFSCCHNPYLPSKICPHRVVKFPWFLKWNLASPVLHYNLGLCQCVWDGHGIENFYINKGKHSSKKAFSFFTHINDLMADYQKKGKKSEEETGLSHLIHLICKKIRLLLHSHWRGFITGCPICGSQELCSVSRYISD